MLTATSCNIFSELEYDIENEPLHAALLTTGNGYMGVRGSFEEFGSLRIQGCYIRGIFDEIYEVIEPFPDNTYMKKYYFNEERLKNFEKQESIINLADILLVRISVAGETFYPWEGKVLSWHRSLDMSKGVLTREVQWDNGKGHITRLCFERFASFYNDHLYCMKVTIIPENHDEEISIVSGIDTRAKTGGQKVSKRLYGKAGDGGVCFQNVAGEKYKFEIGTAISNMFYSNGELLKGTATDIDTEGIIANQIAFRAECKKEYSLEKICYVTTSRDHSQNIIHQAEKGLQLEINKNYQTLLKEHLDSYYTFFGKMDAKIEGDIEADAALRFSSYQTAISIDRNSSLHGVAAKSLSGERYNNFIWWDCEIYQLPIFLHTAPQAAKLALLYRYRLLDAARENASKEGMEGARYPFISSVTGEEKVWEYVRHPFMQIHITADVAWGVLNYYTITGDKAFMEAYGVEMLWECARYWASKVEFVNGRFEIKTVTGTDEHHPYVDNDAYTNYLVHIILNHAAMLYKKYKDCFI